MSSDSTDSHTSVEELHFSRRTPFQGTPPSWTLLLTVWFITADCCHPKFIFVVKWGVDCSVLVPKRSCVAFTNIHAFCFDACVMMHGVFDLVVALYAVVVLFDSGSLSLCWTIVILVTFSTQFEPTTLQLESSTSWILCKNLLVGSVSNNRTWTMTTCFKCRT